MFLFGDVGDVGDFGDFGYIISPSLLGDDVSFGDLPTPDLSYPIQL